MTDQRDIRLRVVVADDEPIAQRGLERLLRAHPTVEVAAVCANGTEALEAIRRHAPDLALLDVAMPGMSGLDVVRALTPEERPAIVFVTAFDQFAIEAFEVHAVDYLLKPFDAERFGVALGRAEERLRGVHGREARIEELLAAWDLRGRALAHLTVRERDRILLVAVADIDWIEADDNYARLHVGGKRHLIRETLRSLERKLASARFVRIHRSTIVNLARVAELRPMFHGEYEVRLHDGTRLTLSRGYRDAVFAELETSG
jgi:two-component system LytT family response regulator